MSAADLTAPTIAFVVPYVGSWPLWFPAYLQSCRYNPSIRWIFYTDCEIPTTVPANVQFVDGSLRDFERLVERKTGMSVSLELPYKLCDYKPAFGLLFEDYLDGVDFWGHCDVDVVWGNIRKFLATDEILSRYDVVSPRRRRIAGACTPVPQHRRAQPAVPRRPQVRARRPRAGEPQVRREGLVALRPEAGRTTAR